MTAKAEKLHQKDSKVKKIETEVGGWGLGGLILSAKSWCARQRSPRTPSSACVGTSSSSRRSQLTVKLTRSPSYSQWFRGLSAELVTSLVSDLIVLA